jgi:RNA exonuclease 4
MICVVLFLILSVLLQIEDARAAMLIYNKHKKAWEKNMKEQFRFKKKLKKRGKKKTTESNGNDPNVPTVLL